MRNAKYSVLIGKIDFSVMFIFLYILSLLVVAGIIATALLLVDGLRWNSVLLITIPTGALLAIWLLKILMRFRDTILPKSRQTERVIVSGLLLLMLVAWGVINIRLTSEHVFVNRDPGIYAVGAIHLSQHDGLRIPASNIFGPGTTTTSAGLGASSVDSKDLYVQGLHLLPAFLGLGGKIFGAINSLKLNVLFGISALIALYLFMTRLVRPYWALVGTAIFAVSMPLIYFSRDTYTEPLAATFTFTGMLFLWLAVENRSRYLWIFAGLATGAATLTRIDGYLAIAATLAFICFYVALAKSSERKQRLVEATMFAVGAGVTGFIGWLDLTLLSSGYFHDLYKNFIQEIAAICLAIFVIVVTSFFAWRTNILQQVDTKLRPFYTYIIGFSISIIVLVLATRQFWDETHGTKGARNFNELTAMWPSWYLGDALVFLALAGIAYALYCLLVKRKLKYLIPLSVIVLTSMLYLVKPSIAPDQIWASRRLVPVILPGFILFAMIAVEQIASAIEKRLKPGVLLRNIIYVIASMFLVITPLAISRPILVSDQYTQVTIMKNFCKSLPDNAAVIWLGTARWWALQSSEELCHVQSAGIVAKNIDASTMTQISEGLEQKHLTPVFALFGSDLNPDPTLLASQTYKQPLDDSVKKFFNLVSSGSYNQLENTIIGAPRSMSTGNLEIYATKLQNGEFVRLTN